MNSLFVVPSQLPYPTGNGEAVHTYGLVRCFQSLGLKVTLLPVEMSSDAQQLARAADFWTNQGVEILDVPELSKQSESFSRIFRAAIFSRESDLFPATPHAKAVVQNVVDDRKIEVVFGYDWTSLGFIHAVKNAKRVACIVDLIDEYYSLRADVRLPFDIKRRCIRWLRRMAVNKRIRLAYRHLADQDLIIESASHHVVDLRERGFPQTEWLPHPMIPPADYRPYQPTSTTELTVLIPGSLKGVASIKGFEFFLDKLLPALRERKSEIRHPFRFRVVGHGRMKESLKSRVVAQPEIDFVGFADDISQEYVSADIVLVNIPIPHGYRTRIAEVFGHGRCVVAHAANCQGMPEVIDGVNALTSDNADGLAARLISAINDAQVRTTMGAAARTTFDESFSYLVASKKLRSYLHMTPAADNKTVLVPPGIQFKTGTASRF